MSSMETSLNLPQSISECDCKELGGQQAYDLASLRQSAVYKQVSQQKEVVEIAKIAMYNLFNVFRLLTRCFFRLDHRVR